MSIIADLSNLTYPVYNKKDEVDFPLDFLNGLNNEIIKDQKKTICVWGGGSKGVIFSLLRERVGMPIDAVIDINPNKQGKFLPSTGLQIFSPDYAHKEIPKDSIVYVINSNYFNEVKKMVKRNFFILKKI